MSRTLPNLNLKAFFALGEDGWNDEVDLNFLKLSTLVQGGVLGIVSTKPSSPAQGATYILAASDGTNPNAVAVFDNGQWVHFTPNRGWVVFDTQQGTYLHFNGTAWVAMPLTSAKIAALGTMDVSEGVVVQTGPDSFSKLPTGVAAATDILTRANGDARFAPLVHTHSDSVLSFMDRQGDVSLLATDVEAALGFAPQPAAASLTGLGALDATAGAVVQTGAGSFTKRAVGAASATDLLDRAAGDARYAGISPILTGLSTIGITEGVLVQTGVSAFAKRAIDVAADATSLPSMGFADARYLRVGNAAFTQLSDVPSTYAATRMLRVNAAADGIEFVARAQRDIATIGTTVHVLTLTNAGQVLRCTNAAELVITVPENANVAFPLGTTIEVVRAGNGNVRFITDAEAYLDLPAGKAAEIDGLNGRVVLIKVAPDRWTVSGDTATTITTATTDYSLSSADAVVRMDVASANTVTVPTGLAHHNGAHITIIQRGAGSTSIEADPGVTINASSLVIGTQYGMARLFKVGPDTWDLING